jgi:ABC-type dipeptide/oligopeptide/nickel transport system permease component
MRSIPGRLLSAIVTLLITWTVVFGAMRLAPGDPVLLMLQGTPISDQAMDAARARLGLDRPFIVQYFSFLADAARGNFGDSFRSRQPVTKLIAAEFPYTLQLAVGGFLIGVLLGGALGIIAGYPHCLRQGAHRRARRRQARDAQRHHSTLTLLGIQFALLIGGAVVTETVFARPGIGRLLVLAVLEKDFPVVQGVVVLTTATYVLINLVIDIAYGLIDPRVDA